MIRKFVIVRWKGNRRDLVIKRKKMKNEDKKFNFHIYFIVLIVVFFFFERNVLS